MDAIKRLENLREEFLANANRCNAKAAVWEAAATLVDDALFDIAQDEEPREAYTLDESSIIKSLERKEPLMSKAVDAIQEHFEAKPDAVEPAPSGTVALEYKFGVGDVVEFAGSEHTIVKVTPRKYVFRVYGDGSDLYGVVEDVDAEATLIRRADRKFGVGDVISYDGAPELSFTVIDVTPTKYYLANGKPPHVEFGACPYTIEHVEEKMVLIRRAGEGEKQARPEFKIGQTWQTHFGNTITIKDIRPETALIDEEGGYWFVWNGGCPIDKWTLLVDAPAPEKPADKPARPAYKAGQVWRDDKGTKYTITEGPNKYGNWRVEWDVMAPHWIAKECVDAWAFVSDAPEAAPEKPKENPLSPSTVQGCKFRRGDVIELDGQQWKIDHLGFMQYELHRPGHVTIVDSATADEKAVLVRPGYRAGQVWKNRNGIPITLVKYRWSESNHQLEWKGQDPVGLPMWFFESDLDHWTFVSEAAP